MKIILKFIAVMAVANLVGCTVLGSFSPHESFSKTEAFEIASPKKDMLETIEAVGVEMEMNVSNVNKSYNMVMLSSYSSTAGLMLIGSQSSITITASVKDDGKLLVISCSASGNYGNGGKSATTKLLDEFQFKLANKLGQKLVDKGEAAVQIPPSIIGTPAPQSKFSKLKLGMSLNQVKSLIGESKDCYYNPKDSSNFSISGSDCPYKNEGLLIFDMGKQQSLFRIVVDTNMGEFRPLQN